MIKLLRKIAKKIYSSGIFRKLTTVTGRNVILAGGLVIIILYNGFSFFATQRLRDEQRVLTDAYVKMIESRLLKESNFSFDPDELKCIISKINLPVIVTDTLWEPILWDNVYSNGVLGEDNISVDNLSKEQYVFLKKKIKVFNDQSKPYSLYLGNSSKQYGYLLIGENRFFSLLSLMPYVEVPILIAYFILTYAVFYNIRLMERSNLWVGLAKETAHQLGTPISSLMGWVEYMRTIHEADPPIEPYEFVKQIGKICDDMDNDLRRLRIVTARFSQIGSIPALQQFWVNESLKEVAEYFQMRLPLLKKRIDIEFNFDKIPCVFANKDLMEWVFENIMKNAIDAIYLNNGLIEIKTEYIEVDKIVRIQYIDNGKGISRDIQQQIFSPGFTTKKRGWGLGLTLAKRIIEEYHNGRIYVSWSQKDKGTALCIDLPSASGQIIA